MGEVLAALRIEDEMMKVHAFQDRLKDCWLVL